MKGGKKNNLESRTDKLAQGLQKTKANQRNKEQKQPKASYTEKNQLQQNKNKIQKQQLHYEPPPNSTPARTQTTRPTINRPKNTKATPEPLNTPKQARPLELLLVKTLDRILKPVREGEAVHR